MLILLYFTVRSNLGRNNSRRPLQTGIRRKCNPRNYLFTPMWVSWFNLSKIPSRQCFPRYLSNKTSKRNINWTLVHSLPCLHKIRRHALILSIALKRNSSLEECLLVLFLPFEQRHDIVTYHISYDISWPHGLLESDVFSAWKILSLLQSEVAPKHLVKTPRPPMECVIFAIYTVCKWKSLFYYGWTKKAPCLNMPGCV